VEEVPRRSFWLTVLGVATAGTYVAYRRALQPNPAPPSAAAGTSDGALVEWERLGRVATRSSTGDKPAGEEPPASTGAAARVRATMEAAPGSAVTNGSRAGNGSMRPSPAPSESCPPPIRDRAELPRGRRPSGATLAGLAAAAAAGALLLGGWAFVSSVRDDDLGDSARPTATSAHADEAIRLLSEPGAQRLPMRRSVRRIVLVVEPGDRGTLVLNGLGKAPTGMAYHAWVTRADADLPALAAIFGGETQVVKLSRPVTLGATVAVTLEQADGVDRPTRTPKLAVTRTS
jgi:hypothetical protein